MSICLIMLCSTAPMKTDIPELSANLLRMSESGITITNFGSFGFSLSTSTNAFINLVMILLISAGYVEGTEVELLEHVWN